jgi:hypothetical protein
MKIKASGNLGKIHPPRTMFLRMYVGKATADKTGDAYEMAVDTQTSAPIIRNLKTGLWWTINWTNLIQLAIEEGIDD